MDKSSYLLELNRYIVLNPVRARMVNQPEDWLWSSYLYTLGKMEASSWFAIDQTLVLFARNREQACERFIDFVASGCGVDVWKGLSNQIFLGDESFVREQQQRVKDLQLDLNEVPHQQARPACKSLSFYAASCIDQKRSMAMAYQSGGCAMAEIATYFGVHYSTVSRACARGKN